MIRHTPHTVVFVSDTEPTQHITVSAPTQKIAIQRARLALRRQIGEKQLTQYTVEAVCIPGQLSQS